MAEEIKAPRRLHYANTPGEIYWERSWLKSRMDLYGETLAQAQTEIDAMINSGKIKVIPEA